MARDKDMSDRMESSSLLYNASNHSLEYHEDFHQHTIYPLFSTLMTLIMVISIAGNSVVVAAMAKTKRLQKLRHFFIYSLALSDIGVAVTAMPFHTIQLYQGGWRLPWTACMVYQGFDISCNTVSVFNLVAISLERFYSISYPMQYDRCVTSRKLKWIIFMLWFASFTYGFLQLLWLDRGSFENNSDILDKCTYKPDFIYSIVVRILEFWLPLCTMVVVYFRIYCIVKQQVKMHEKLMHRITSSNVLSEQGSELHQREPLLSVKEEDENEENKDSTSIQINIHGLEKCSTYDGDLFKDFVLNYKKYYEKPVKKEYIRKRRNTACMSRPILRKQRPRQLKTYRSASLPSDLDQNSTFLPAWMHEIQIRINPYQNNASHADEKNEYRNYSREISTTMKDIIQNPLDLQTTAFSFMPGTRPRRVSMVKGCTVEGMEIKPQKNKLYIKFKKWYKTHKAKLRRRLHKDSFASKLFALIIAAFVICWSPYGVTLSLHTPCATDYCVHSIFWEFVVLLKYANSAVNPFIYAFYSKEFRDAFWRVLHCHPHKNLFERNSTTSFK
ncbi:histamine H2 receptor [Lingula anatina]|uniref:Histamine H2 receptor n=1 Tax=Lingula anatina TaxID=7574 RepID=A0A1S3J471_LINAN|nr:histamine H2 receptor [Lingula anatina]|eukprot:XP_013404639.1 histamine H2 receptor [Lingula anatina]